MERNDTEPLCSITVKQWDTVAFSARAVEAEKCVICTEAIDDVCIECRCGGGGGGGGETSANELDVKRYKQIQGQECPVVWGMCDHVFHSHCISRWTLKQPTCPRCGRAWEVSKTERNGS